MNRRKGHPSEPVADGMGGIKPVVMVPDDNARTYAEATAPAQIDGDSPALHSTEEMRRLATPWSVAIAKAKLLASCQLPPGGFWTLHVGVELSLQPFALRCNVQD